jgi:hypothetical protein
MAKRARISRSPDQCPKQPCTQEISAFWQLWVKLQPFAPAHLIALLMQPSTQPLPDEKLPSCARIVASLQLPDPETPELPEPVLPPIPALPAGGSIWIGSHELPAQRVP